MATRDRRNFGIERVRRERIAKGGLCGDGRDRFSVVYWLHDSGLGFVVLEQCEMPV